MTFQRLKQNHKPLTACNFNYCDFDSFIVSVLFCQGVVLGSRGKIFERCSLKTGIISFSYLNIYKVTYLILQVLLTSLTNADSQIGLYATVSGGIIEITFLRLLFLPVPFSKVLLHRQNIQRKTAKRFLKLVLFSRD